MEKIFPFHLEITEEEKKKRNLRVINKTAPKEYDDYAILIPAVNVYRYQKDKWEKLKIEGTLFLLTSATSPYPIIFILNNKLIKDPHDFCFKVVRRAEISLENKVVYLRFGGEDNICLSMISENDAEQFANVFKSLSLKIPDEKIVQPINNSVEDDPSYRHLANFIRRSRDRF